MMAERGIKPEWVNLALTNPDDVENHDDGTKHFLKRIMEYENRWLRVIVNSETEPPRGITVFFDRRLRKQNENQIR